MPKRGDLWIVKDSVHATNLALVLKVTRNSVQYLINGRVVSWTLEAFNGYFARYDDQQG